MYLYTYTECVSLVAEPHIVVLRTLEYYCIHMDVDVSARHASSSKLSQHMESNEHTQTTKEFKTCVSDPHSSSLDLLVPSIPQTCLGEQN